MTISSADDSKTVGNESVNKRYITGYLLITFSTALFWKSKLTGFRPGEDNVDVGESTNLVH